jgi:hypothetical protein
MSMPLDPRNAPPRHKIGSGFDPSAGKGAPVDPQHSAAADAAAAASVPEHSSKTLALGFLVAAVVAVVGGLLWAVVSIASGYNIGVLAWLVGAATGFAVQLVTRGPVAMFERVLAGLFAAAAIIVGKYVIFVHELRDALVKLHAPPVGYFDSDVISEFVHNFGTYVRPIYILWVGLAFVAAIRMSGLRLARHS